VELGSRGEVVRWLDVEIVAIWLVLCSMVEEVCCVVGNGGSLRCENNENKKDFTSVR